MKFSDTTNKNGIIQTCETLLDLGDTGISGNTTLLAQFTNLINRAYDNTIAQILKNSGDWVWDDSLYTTFPIGMANLVQSQSDYVLPRAYDGSIGSTDESSILRLIEVSVKDLGGNYQTLYPISETMVEAPLETTFPDSGFPKYYKLFDRSVILYPPPSSTQVTLTNGLKITFQRDKVDFITSDTTRQPGFPSIYHYLIPLEASEMWAAIKGMKQFTFLQQKKAEFQANLGWGIANQNKDARQRLRPYSATHNSIRE